MTDHTVKSFTEQLESLSALVAQMGGLAEAQLPPPSKRSPARQPGGGSAVGGDARIDAMQQEIEDRALKLLALRQPMAVDLRETWRRSRPQRAGTHRRPGQEHRQARHGAEPRAAHPPHPVARPHGPRRAEPAQAGAGRLFQPQRRLRRSGVERRTARSTKSTTACSASFSPT
jgi:hypothetical protein